MNRSLYQGFGMPLVRNNIDTDQIMPARFCYKPSRHGHENSVFGDWRRESNFVLNDKRYQRASILVAGREFATGSSREYAVWGLKDWGFNVIVAPSFGDIFYRNAIINDLLPLRVIEEDIEQLWSLLEQTPNAIIKIDLNQNQLTAGGLSISIDINEIYKQRYIDNKDDIAITLEKIDLITAFEHKREMITKEVTKS